MNDTYKRDQGRLRVRIEAELDQVERDIAQMKIDMAKLQDTATKSDRAWLRKALWK